MGIRDRRKLSFAGHVAVNVVLDDKYELAGDPDLVAIGVAEADAGGEALEELMLDAAIGAVDSHPARSAERTSTWCRKRSAAPCAARPTKPGARSRW